MPIWLLADKIGRCCFDRAKPVSERAKLLSGQCEAPQGAKPVRFDLRRGPRVGGALRS